MSRIELIGISGSSGRGEGLNPEQRELISACVLVAHSRRQESLLQGMAIERVPVTPLIGLYRAIESGLTKGNVAVLASGDPLFFGIGRNLIERFGAERVRVHPALSALQLACSRFKIPWDDLAIISLHGRRDDHPAARILRHERVLCFTDQEHSPDSLARHLIATLESVGDSERLLGMRMRVAENLGLSDERLSEGGLVEMAKAEFSPLNMVLFEQSPGSVLLPQETLPLTSLPVFGLQEGEISHSRGLITKDEVRAASLHRLRLPARGVLWDVGGGSGSVSLEAARLSPGLAVYTIEKKSEEQDNIRRNIKTYAAYSIRLITGEAPEALAHLPAPDRVFIGGSGKRLEEILRVAASRLRPGGRIVVNAVLATTRESACRTLAELGFQVACSTISVQRYQYQEGQEDQEEAQLEPTVQSFNPITIVTGSI